MLEMRTNVHPAVVSAGHRARVSVATTPTDWFFATNAHGERPTGAPPD